MLLVYYVIRNGASDCLQILAIFEGEYINKCGVLIGINDLAAKKCLSQCHCVYHQSHTDCPLIEPRSGK